ncbi:hypothetical protein BRADO3887 [Bradyrhizobium sp. ORS 278]|nr:hypothetical protein BRADO3887 [Bradyrhizobium sp. ORS 278]
MFNIMLARDTAAVEVRDMHIEIRAKVFVSDSCYRCGLGTTLSIARKCELVDSQFPLMDALI